MHACAWYLLSQKQQNAARANIISIDTTADAILITQTRLVAFIPFPHSGSKPIHSFGLNSQKVLKCKKLKSLALLPPPPPPPLLLLLRHFCVC